MSDGVLLGASQSRSTSISSRVQRDSRKPQFANYRYIVISEVEQKIARYEKCPSFPRSSFLALGSGVTNVQAGWRA